MYKLLFAVVLLLSFACLEPAWAETLVEPTTSVDGAVLDDLQDCRAIVTDQIGRTGSTVFTASSPAGGGSHQFDSAAVLPIGEGDIDVFAVCADVGGAESAESNHLSKQFPRIAPAAPTLAP